MSRLDHPLTEEELMAYADGQLQEGEASKALEHIQECAKCAAVVDDARQLSRQMTSWKVEAAPGALRRAG